MRMAEEQELLSGALSHDERTAAKSPQPQTSSHIMDRELPLRHRTCNLQWIDNLTQVAERSEVGTGYWTPKRTPP